MTKSEQFLELPGGGSRLLARTELFYDERGRNWKTVQSVVNPTTGAVTSTIQSLQWFDAVGRVIKSQNSASPRYTKTMYDSLGNAFKTYIVTGMPTSIFATSFQASIHEKQYRNRSVRTWLEIGDTSDGPEDGTEGEVFPITSAIITASLNMIYNILTIHFLVFARFQRRK